MAAGGLFAENPGGRLARVKPVQIETHTEGPVLVVKLLDRALDAYAAGSFNDRMAELIQEGHDLIVLDMEAVEFLDSAGLGAVISCLKRLGRRGSVALCGCKAAVLQVLRLARMDRVLTIAGDAEEAIAAVAGEGG